VVLDELGVQAAAGLDITRPVRANLHDHTLAPTLVG
jgi:hypothetical protein